MHHRRLGKTDWNVSEVSFGAWAIGGTWGAVEDETSLAALNAAIDAGCNFIDTADVYGDGRSERLIAKLKKDRARDTIYVATKAGRRSNPHTTESYNKANLTKYVERSLQNLQAETLDLVQLHCPPTDVYYRAEVFGVMDDLMKAGKVRHYGVSVERVEEAMHALDYRNVVSVQIIYNIFRQRPADHFFAMAQAADVGILARLPLSSGLLSGKMKRTTQFSADDHRAFNRQGEAFDKGETFSGVDYELSLEAVEKLRPLVPEGMTMAQFALRWILMHPAVTCVIPGAKTPEQARANSAASTLPPLSAGTMEAVKRVYDEMIKPAVHFGW